MASKDSSEETSSNDGMSGIEEPHSNDVLCGRGVTTNKWAGNEQFRSLVGLNKELYVTSTKRQKMAISRSIVHAVRTMNPPGRFLERKSETGLWSDIGDRKAMEKTSQALRDGAATLRKQLSEDLGDPDFLSAVFDMDMDATSTSTKSVPAKPKEKPVKAKTVKKGHRRTKSMPDPAILSRKPSIRCKTINAPSSPLASVRRQSRGGSSQPSSPCTSSSPYHIPSPPPVGEFGPSYSDRSYEFPPGMSSWGAGPSVHRRRHTSYIPMGFPPQHPPHPSSPPGRTGFNGYWGRPPMSPHGSWSPSPMPTLSHPMSPNRHVLPISPMSFRSYANSDYADQNLSLPTLGKKPALSLAPSSPRVGRLSPRYPRSPVSPRDFTPPISPRSNDKREGEVVLTAKDPSGKKGASPTSQTSNRDSKSPTDVASSDEALNESKINVELQNVELVVRNDKTRCESPLHGDKVESLYLDPAAEDPMDADDPLPFEAFDQNALMEISEDILRLPIAPCGHLD